MAEKKAPTKPGKLTGWSSIAAYLGIPAATAHRWAKDAMPVRRQGRFTVADAEELSVWLGRESHMPGAAHVVTGATDLESALKESIATAKTSKT